MSVELMCYSLSDDPVGLGDLIDALALRGWTAQFLDPETAVPIEGTCLSDCHVFGWPIDSRCAPEIQDALQQNDQPLLDSLHHRSEIASIAVYLEHPFRFEEEYPDEEDQRDLRSLAGRRALNRMRQASTLYTLHSSAGRSQIAVPFQEALAACICMLTDALYEDPQTDEYVLYRKGRAKRVGPLWRRLLASVFK